MMLDSYGLFPNIRKIMRRVYDQSGRAVDTSPDNATYTNFVADMFRTYLTTRDRDLKLTIQHDLEEYQKEIKSASLETASRNFIKQSFERVYNEEGLFAKIFGLEPTWTTSPGSALQALKSINTTMAHSGNLAPIATNVRSALYSASLQTVCDIVGWLASAYSMNEDDDEESPFFRKCLEYTARLLVEYLWPLTDNAFDAEITKSITKAQLQDSSLKIGKVQGGVASSNAHPLVKRAVELLVMFDQAMPKQRSVSPSYDRSLKTD
jgi:hypothetical protein